MTPVEMMRLQMVLAFGALEMQRKLVGAAWQLALWSMPGGAALPEVGRRGAEAGRRKVRT
jgi:hypothetical protein